MTHIPNPLASTARARPQHIVLRLGSSFLTAQQLCDAVCQRAAYLAKAGVSATDRVALLAVSSLEVVIDVHAVGWLGAVVVPLPPGAPAAELTRCLQALAPRWLLLSAGLDAGLVARMRAALAAVRKEPAGDPPMIVMAPPPEASSGAARATWPGERFWPLAEPRLVLLSSGSTGTPHPVVLHTEQLLFSAFGSAIRLGHRPEDLWLCCLPLHHIGGLSILFRAAWFGSAIELMPRFDAVAVARHLDGGGISLAALVPRMLERVLDVRPGTAFAPQLRAILLGGAPAAEPLLRRCRAQNLPVSVTWGMTEAASQVATAWPGEVGEPGQIGPPLAFARVMASGGPGSGPLRIEGPVVGAAGYVSGDCGWLSPAGHVHVAARVNDVIISGGENITPFEVESVLMSCPGVIDAAVVGVADRVWGQRPVAVLVALHEPINDAALNALCRAHLAAFKVPKKYVWSEGLPRDALGKLQRRKLVPLVDQGVADD